MINKIKGKLFFCDLCETLVFSVVKYRAMINHEVPGGCTNKHKAGQLHLNYPGIWLVVHFAPKHIHNKKIDYHDQRRHYQCNTITYIRPRPYGNYEVNGKTGIGPFL